METQALVRSKGRVLAQCSCGFQTKKFESEDEAVEQIREHATGQHPRFNLQIHARESKRKGVVREKNV